MLHPEYPVVSFLSVLLLICSAPSHIRARNIATISLHLWLAVLSIIRGINSIAWADNVEIKLLVWCDITTKIDIGFTLAIPASALCLMVHLESIASASSVRNTSRDTRRRQIFEFVMCFLVPIILMALHYIVQGHRFDIYQDQGCLPAIYVSLPAIFIIWVPPLVFACISFIFAALSFRHFLRHRILFSNHLHQSSAISPHRYFRLMILALVEMVWDLGTNVWVLWLNVSFGLNPWTSWDYVHSGFSRVHQLPYILLPQSVIDGDEFVWWIPPVSCLLVFIIFGTGREAMADYSAAFNWFRRKILRQKVTSNLNTSPLSSMSQSLPVTKRDIRVSIPFVRPDVSTPDVNNSPTKPSLFRSPSSQTFYRRSLSRNSIFIKAEFDASPAFPPASPTPGIGAETSGLSDDAPGGIETPPPAHINSARPPTGSNPGTSTSEPFLYSNRLSRGSDHTMLSSVFPCNQYNYKNLNDSMHVDNISPV